MAESKALPSIYTTVVRGHKKGWPLRQWYIMRPEENIGEKLQDVQNWRSSRHTKNISATRVVRTGRYSFENLLKVLLIS